MALMMLLCLSGAVWAGGGVRDKYNEGEIVVGLIPGADINAFNARHGTTTKETLPGADQYLLAIPLGVKVESKVAEVGDDADILCAGPNFKFQSAEVRQHSQAYLDQRSQACLAGTSPMNFYAQPSTLRLHLNEAQLWSRGAGVCVAVIDTGLDFNHPLFAGRIAYPNFDFVDNDNTPDDVMGGSGSGHGTFVSGLIALSAPGATIMPLRAFSADGIGTSFNIAKAIRFAADNGALIVNMSFGLLDRDKLIDDALSYAYSRVYCVSAAGNDNQNFLHFPAERKSKTLSVVSTDDNDRKASWSNYHREAQLAAPGVNLYSAYPGGRWATWSGTSFSTALVTGEAALVLSLNPTLGRTAMTNLMTGAGLNINTLNPKYAGLLGNVRMDFLTAVQQAFAR